MDTFENPPIIKLDYLSTFELDNLRQKWIFLKKMDRKIIEIRIFGFFGISFETNHFSETIFEIDKANAFTFLSRKSFARVDKLWPNNAPALWKTGELVIDLELRYFG